MKDFTRHPTGNLKISLSCSGFLEITELKPMKSQKKDISQQRDVKEISQQRDLTRKQARVFPDLKVSNVHT